MRRLKELQSELEGLRVFESPKVLLEQYPTSAHLAAQMIFTAESTYGDIADRSVADLGCGCGVLSIAARLAGAAVVLGVDIDGDALRIAAANFDDLEMSAEVDLLQANVAPPRDGEVSALERLDGRIETVIMNPPFGTKQAGVDMIFLERACRMAARVVYSLHKSSTRDYIRRRARTFGFSGDVLAQMRFDLPRTMRFHKQASRDIEVDMWRFVRHVGP